MRTGHCQKCGKPFSVAEGVVQVTCQYCDARIKLAVAAKPPQGIKQPSSPPLNPSIPQPGAQETRSQPPTPSDGGRIWYAVINGAQQGPFSKSELAALARDSQINAGTHVWRHGMPGWFRAGAIPEMRCLFPARAEPYSKSASPELPLAPLPPQGNSLQRGGQRQHTWVGRRMWIALIVGSIAAGVIALVITARISGSLQPLPTFEYFRETARRKYFGNSVLYEQFVADFGKARAVQFDGKYYYYYYSCQEGTACLKVGIYVFADGRKRVLFATEPTLN